MPRITIAISPSAAQQLVRLAAIERRKPRDQAAVVLEQVLLQPPQPAAMEATSATC